MVLLCLCATAGVFAQDQTYGTLRLSKTSTPHIGVLQFGLADVLLESTDETTGYGLKLSTFYNSAYNDGIKLNADGKVGIGTTVPRAMLDVARYATNGALATVFARQAEGNATGEGTYLGAKGFDTQQAFGGKSFSIEHGFWGTTNNSINFYRGGGIQGGFMTFNTNNNTERLRITSDGKVGINKTTPSALVDIFTDTPTTNSYASQQWSTVNANYFLTLNTVWSGDGLNYNFVHTFNGTAYTSLSFFKGDVGIGTSRPDAKLAVKGRVHAEEVKVDLAVPAPDYVFDKNYPLMPLNDVANYISANKHLPDVPDAMTMEEQGVNLGETNMMLLKKVEELTLYLIEVNNKVEALITENNELRASTSKGK